MTLGTPRLSPKIQSIKKQLEIIKMDNEKTRPERNKNISIDMIEILSSPMACHLVTDIL
jgi:hypothetical protein